VACYKSLLYFAAGNQFGNVVHLDHTRTSAMVTVILPIFLGIGECFLSTTASYCVT